MTRLVAVAVEPSRQDNSARGADLAARVRLREVSNEEGNRLLRIVRRTSGSVVTWRRAQVVLLAAQGMTPKRISEVVFTDPDTPRASACVTESLRSTRRRRPARRS